jgi:hypothetical protein
MNEMDGACGTFGWEDVFIPGLVGDLGGRTFDRPTRRWKDIIINI